MLENNAMRGIPLEPTTVASIDDYMLAAVLILFILLGFNARHMSRICEGFVNDLWNVRQRNNIFSEHVAGETQTMFLLLLLASVLEGVLLWNCFGSASGYSVGMTFLIYTLLAIGFNLFSIIACSVVGYTFTTPALALQWRRGLLASQAILGLALLLPTVIAIVRPNASQACLILGIVFYILARLLYVGKGFRIFYDQTYSWVFFILYLCTLEIIPILVIARIIRSLG